MTASLGKICADFSSTLNLKTAIWATSATLDSATDDDGVALPTWTYFLTLDRKSANKEYIKCTLTSTALTDIYHVSRQGALTSGTTKTHRKGATVEITDFAIIKKMLDLLDWTTNFNSSVTLGYDWTATISSANQFATKAYVDATATWTTNFDQVVIAGNAGATVSAGQLLYLDVADGEWKLCDADTAATVDNIILGLAQGAGTDGNTITGGILTYGLDRNQTGLTNNAPYYASNTAWGISSSAGTVEVSVGVARSTTSLFFAPRYNQQITEDIQDALVGTSGTPSTSNKYVTNDDTATASTADKVARRLAGGNITVVTETTGNNTTNASSTAFVQQEILAAGIPSVNSIPNSILTSNSYFTQVLMPTVWPTADAISNGWSESNVVMTANQGGGWIVYYTIVANASSSISTLLPGKWAQPYLRWSDIGANPITIKTRLYMATWPWATEAISWWLGGLTELEDSVSESIRFCIADNTWDKLYTVTADTTTPNTNNNVTGALTIEDAWLNLAMVITSTQVLFYAGNNGDLTLVATHTTDLPTSNNQINIGWGVAANNSPQFYMSPIYISLPTT